MSQTYNTKEEEKFAMQERGTSLMNCFQNVSSNKKRGILEISYEFNGFTLIIEGRTLDATDQSIFLELLHLAPLPENPLVIDITDQNLKGKAKELANNLNTMGDLQDFLDNFKESYVVRATPYSILKGANMGTSAESKERLYESIERLAKTNITIKKYYPDGKKYKKFVQSFFSTTEIDTKAEYIEVTLNGILSSVFSLGSQYSKIDLNERAELSMKGAKKGLVELLHYRLSCLVPVGRSQKVNIDTLIKSLYQEQYLPKNLNDTRKRVRDAIERINSLDKWNISDNGKKAGNTVFTISR